MQGNEPILQVEGLTKYFPIRGKLFERTAQLHAVEDMSFNVYKGKTIGIVGESGSGKSTVARLILKLIPATAGRVIYEGRDILPLREHQSKFVRQQMQMIFQDPYASLDPRFKIGSSLEEPLREHKIIPHSQMREMIGDMLEKVGLQREMVSRFPHEFSGGQRQRINIARALLMNPSIIICDEAVSALDVSVQAQVLNLFNQLKWEFDLTYLFISHDLSVVKFVSDTIIVMYMGEMMEMASTNELFQTPAHPYTQALISAIPDPNPLAKKQRILLEGDIPSPVDPPIGCRFASRCQKARQRCHEEHPQLTELCPGHAVRCLFANE
ncbi:MAG TPA: ATP-binding cassette domain-containing protein [Candidatus Pullichristensenella stercorigallinarum]|uniref:ATP-binding cassette domain-containing protein n=1 Tax=Candidatus Pullichristensenella stercorigallinarum TaxID=2840909 RepID=A0A9D0ZPV5_9FIRM|nr:ATP-binding cassette domain-containing protein [Candidatus Pullichristensenella stercorigallinarum]